MNYFIFLVLYLFLSVCYADQVLNQQTEAQIGASLAKTGWATVIVGLSDPETASNLSATEIKCTKKMFLSSMPVADSLANQSMQVVDELENLPFVVINVDAAGMDVLKRHPGIVSIEADFPIKLQ